MKGPWSGTIEVSLVGYTRSAILKGTDRIAACSTVSCIGAQVRTLTTAACRRDSKAWNRQTRSAMIGVGVQVETSSKTASRLDPGALFSVRFVHDKGGDSALL